MSIATAPTGADTSTDDKTFHLPPVLHNARGAVRRAGFEFEFSGPSLKVAALIVKAVFGGGRHVIDDTFLHRVTSCHGDFKVEVDTTVLKDRTYEAPLRALGVDPDRHDTRWIERALLGALSTVVPTEIATPPIPVTDLNPLDTLRHFLRQNGAKGTRSSVFYAFGLHINPEIPSEEPAVLLNHLRAVILLYPWLKREGEVDVTRSISPYINKFPSEYCRLILRDDYPLDDTGRLIDDYLAQNSTRNRPLDMLPVLAHLDRQRVMHNVQEKHLVKARPSFHYRLPNCMVDERQWTVAGEWNRWVAVERLAGEADKLAAMSRDYLAADESSFRPFVDKWPAVLDEYLQECSGRADRHRE